MAIGNDQGPGVRLGVYQSGIGWTFDELPICTVFGFDDSGEVIAGRVYYDMLTLYRQLGLPVSAQP